MGHRAARATAIVVGILVFLAASAVLVAAPLVIPLEERPETTTTITTTTETTTDADGATTTKTVQTEQQEPVLSTEDTSIIGRAFANPGLPIVLAYAVALLVAYISAALLHRFLIGQFGIKLGPLELAPVTEAAVGHAVAKLSTSSLGDTIRSIQIPGEPSFQRMPLYTDIADRTQRFLTLRFELESRLRRLAEARGIEAAEIPARGLPWALAAEALLDGKAAGAMEDLLGLGDRVAAGAEVEPSTLKLLNEGETLPLLLWTLDQLRLLSVRARRAVPASSLEPDEPSWVDEVLIPAVRDEAGRIIVRDIPAFDGTLVRVPVTGDGSPLTFWRLVHGELPPGTARDAEGRAHFTLTLLPGGWARLPLDERGAPLLVPVASVRHNPDYEEGEVAHIPRRMG